MKEIAISILIGCSIIAVIVGAQMLLSRSACHAKWSGKFNPEWGLLSGCIISVDGSRIPAENYRDF